MRSARLVVLSALLVVACAKADDPKRVVLYAAIDRDVAEPLIAAFEKETGLTVETIFDSEAAKTVALAHRLMVEKSAPRADVWWSGESLYTARLAQADLLRADTVVRPAFRLRVLVAKRENAARMPARTADLVRAEFREKIAVARTTVGTTAGWMSFVAGTEKGRGFLESFARSEPLFVGGNALAVEAVVRGDALFAMTDIDDATHANANHAELSIALLDDPSVDPVRYVGLYASAAIVSGAPHAANARRFVEFLAGRTAAPILAADGWAWPTDRTVAADSRLPAIDRASIADPGDFGGAAAVDAARRFLDRVFERR